MFSDNDGSEESRSTVQYSGSEPPSPALTVKYSSDDSGSTVELQVSKSLVYRMRLRSQSKKSVSPEPTPEPTPDRRRKERHHKILMYLRIHLLQIHQILLLESPRGQRKIKENHERKRLLHFTSQFSVHLGGTMLMKSAADLR